ncbi:hypothetical protein BH10ACT9_BH10ACT9_43240 [soil metagenome]
MPPVALGLLTGIAILTYADELAFGSIADRDNTPDIELLADKIREAVAELVSISRELTAATDPYDRPRR